MGMLWLYIHIRYASLTKYKICHHSKQARTHRRWGILRLWDYSWPQLVTQMQTDYFTRKSLFLLSFWVGSSSQKKAKRHSHNSFSCMSTLPHSFCILTFLVKKNRENTPNPSSTPFLSCCVCSMGTAPYVLYTKIFKYNCPFLIQRLSSFLV